MDSRYSFSLTTFSPSGKLVQIEYALNAVNAGATALGIKGEYYSFSLPPLALDH
jgi:20S proteasome subunit alpha 2